MRQDTESHREAQGDWGPRRGVRGLPETPDPKKFFAPQGCMHFHFMLSCFHGWSAVRREVVVCVCGAQNPGSAAVLVLRHNQRFWV